MNLKNTFKEFNTIYKLPINQVPVLLEVERLKNFKSILLEEVFEVDNIIKMQEQAQNADQKFDVLTLIADWLGDIAWYVNSEAIKYGLDMNKILKILRKSNLSKLDSNNKPIYDTRGKVVKGSNYIAPESLIKKYITRQLNNSD